MQKLNILSHGAGVQTSCMVYMVLEGDLPHPDVIIFADPKWELKATYDYLQKVIEDVRGSGIPMMIESGGGYLRRHDQKRDNRRTSTIHAVFHGIRDRGSSMHQ